MMVHFDVGQQRFNMRAAAIIQDEGHILLCQSHLFPTFWFLPGGRVDLMEPSPETVRREVAEELGAEIELGPLQYVVESFFHLEGRDFHEIGFYYQAAFRDRALYDKGRTWQNVVDGPYQIDLRWFRLEELEQIDLRPAQLAEALRNPPVGVGHIITRG